MAILTVGFGNRPEKLNSFDVKCKACGSENVELQIDWAAYPSASWNKLTIVCNDCFVDEKVYDSNA